MFQSAWFDAKSYSKKPERMGEVPSNFITTDKIELVKTIYFDEHCLECSAPACYGNCPHYLPRKDLACKRFCYGIKHLRGENKLLWDIAIKFRHWGKIEARINKGTLTPKQIKKLDKIDKFKTKIFKTASAIMCSSNYNLSTKFDGLKRQKYAKIESGSQFLWDFLFQCYSHSKQEYSLVFEITDKQNNVVYKTNFDIKNGYNQRLLKLNFPTQEGGLVRLYPENNIEAELEIFALDFVLLKGSIPQTPNKKVKCVAWDLDNTVWDGIFIESNPDSLKLKPNVEKTIKELDQRGIIQIVASKNNQKDVLPVLERLGIAEYFIYVLANWGAKSNSLFKASKMLNINIDTFALIDDSYFERNEVKASLPSVRVYDENIEDILNLQEFNQPKTVDSAKRRLSYKQEALRQSLKEDDFSGNNEQFVKSCNFVIKVKKLESKEEFDRSLELIQRTNQLNLSGKKYTSEEFEELVNNSNITPYIVFAKDKYGDYGQVAFLTVEALEQVKIKEYAMSCRVASKYVESALFNYLQQKHKKDIVLQGIKTKRNGLLLEALLDTGFEDITNEENTLEFILKNGKNVNHLDIVRLMKGF